MQGIGWILDAYIEGSNSVVWVKTEDGQILKGVEPYRPDFYAKPKGVSAEELSMLLGQHEHIVRVEVERRYRTIDQREEVEVVHVYVDGAGNFKRVLSDVERLRFVDGTYNTDLLHVQRYLFRKGVAPMEKVGYEVDERGLLEFEAVDEDLEIPPPPFRAAIFRVEANREGIKSIVFLDEDLKPAEVLRGEEEGLLQDLDSRLSALDPDLLICRRGDLRRLSERAEMMGVELRLGREPSMPGQSPKGRVHIDFQAFRRLGLAGVGERARFTMVPASLSALWPAGKTIDSRQCYEAYRRGILIPKAGFYLQPMTAEELALRDQGGLVLSPEVGLHENVGVLDFESMFPNIIVRRNVSYETVTPRGVDTSREGFLVGLTREVLERRLHFKHLRKRFPTGSREWLWCEQRQLALKEILVCIYGYSGCFANRFGNVTTYQEINRIAREELVRSMRIAKERGYQVIYGDNDSLFLKKSGASTEDYERLAEEISKEVDLPMTLDHHFQFLVLLPQKVVEELGATKRYYGKLVDGSLFYRGIELRRHDTPPFLKRVQERIMEILFNAENVEGVLENLKRVLGFVEEACRAVIRGEVNPEDLVISRALRKSPENYKGRPPHVVATRQLVHVGKKPQGVVNFVYVNTGHSNPFRRVAPMAEGGWLPYDRRKYASLIRDIAESLLRPLSSIKGANPFLGCSSLPAVKKLLKESF